MRHETATSHTHRIWIAGDYADAKKACRLFTTSGLCVAVQAVDYIYTLGAESGVCVTLINYPRFPASPAEIEAKAIELGHHLCCEMVQGSFTVEGPDQMHWFSRRDQDQPTE
jgi:hypothetical protein